ncbi:hypothetical protein BGZ54_005305 [Gamsiella multidivaricata]|nr:hypothetical protein BGZ54_005305 [Gamsiella multidivaricata]
MLAVLLEQAHISYEIFEKAKELKPLGSALSLHNSLMVIFEQLDMYQDILGISKPFGALHFLKEDMSVTGSLLARRPGVDCAEHYGDYNRVVGRPDLISLLLKRVPPHKLHYNKRVLTTKQDENEVILQCSDSTSYAGSILVGADGAYSSVRQNLYKKLAMVGALPKDDAKPLGYSYDCVVGISDRLDPNIYPVVLEEYCEFQAVLANDSPYTWWFMPLVGNKISWMVTHDVRKHGTDEDRNFRFSEWSPIAAMEMCQQVRHLPCPYGGTVGDIIDHTSADLISKVMLEDKFFSTWYSGRTVLLGDACHKMVPFGGQGANMAILGALHLTNLLYDMYSVSQDEITQVFRKYYDMRWKPAKTSVDGSKKTGILLHKKGVVADSVRFMFLNWIPNWAIKLGGDKLNARRDQISFLPYVKLRGSYSGSQVNPPSRRIVHKAYNARAV